LREVVGGGFLAEDLFVGTGVEHSRVGAGVELEQGAGARAVERDGKEEGGFVDGVGADFLGFPVDGGPMRVGRAGAGRGARRPRIS
jgi:hypothetical protein